MPNQLRWLEEMAAGIFAHNKTGLVFEWPLLLSDYLEIDSKKLKQLRGKTEKARVEFDEKRMKICQALYKKTIAASPKEISNLRSEFEHAMKLEIKLKDLLNSRLIPGNKLENSQKETP